MDNKFLGVGLFNAVGLTLFAIAFIVILKAVLTKYPVNGLSQIVQAV